MAHPGAASALPMPTTADQRVRVHAGTFNAELNQRAGSLDWPAAIHSFNCTEEADAPAPTARAGLPDTNSSSCTAGPAVLVQLQQRNPMLQAFLQMHSLCDGSLMHLVGMH